MKLNAFILGLTLAASVQVFAEEVTLSVWHKLSDHESFERRGLIRINTEDWDPAHSNPIHQQNTNAANAKLSRKQQQVLQQQQAALAQKQAESLVYENLVMTDKLAKVLKEDFVLNVQAPVKPLEEFSMEEPMGRDLDENGEYAETEEDYESRVAEYEMQLEERKEMEGMERLPGSFGFYQIKLRDEKRDWEAISSIKSCLLVAGDFKEEITLHLDHNKQVFAFDYYTGASHCSSQDKKELALETLDRFSNVKLDLVGGQAGPKARYVKAQAIKFDETGKPEVEKTFFQKYWVYIVPIVLVMLLTGGEPEKTAA